MRVGIFGAGQAGLMLCSWLPANIEVVCFFDNYATKHGMSLENISVLPFENAQELDAIIIAVLNREAAAEIQEQIKAAGFSGEVLNIYDIQKFQDLRLSTLRLLAKQIRERKISGEVAELGVYRGNFAAEINRIFPDKKIYLFDTFTGFDEKDLQDAEPKMNFSNTSVNLVKKSLPYPSQAVFVVGHFPESLSSCQILPEIFSLVSLDADLYAPTLSGLEYFYPRLTVGGVILIHDYNGLQFPGIRKAVDEFCEKMRLFVIPLMDLHGTAILLKQGA
mgnify:CR=1 FL=1